MKAPWLALAATLASLLAAEGWLRLTTLVDDACFQYDALLGWDNEPSCKGRFRGAEFDTRVVTNRQRMRETEEFGAADERVRIAVAGDSFVWGHGVNEAERMTERLQTSLGPGYEVMNFGVGGFGPAQVLLKVERDVLPLRPDVLVVVFFVNDLLEVQRAESHLGIPKPRWSAQRERPESRRAALPRVEGWQEADARRRWPRLWQLVRRALEERPDPGLDAGEFFNPEHLALLDRSKPAALEAGLAATASVYAALKRSTDARGIRLVLTEVPFKEYFLSDGLLANRFDLARSDLQLDRPRRSHSRLCRRLGATCADAYRAFSTHGRLAHYFRGDQHLNALGHARMAEVLEAGVEAAR